MRAFNNNNNNNSQMIFGASDSALMLTLCALQMLVLLLLYRSAQLMGSAGRASRDRGGSVPGQGLGKEITEAESY